MYSESTFNNLSIGDFVPFAGQSLVITAVYSQDDIFKIDVSAMQDGEAFTINGLTLTDLAGVL